MIDMAEIQRRAQRIPPLPSVAMKVLRVLEDPESAMEEIVEIIRLDPSLTLRILKICNSPYYGLSREIRSLQEAVVLLGVDALVNMVLTSGLSSILSLKCSGYKLESGELWLHSICCAISAEITAERNSPALKSQAFTGGLLHDVGKIVLSSYIEEEFDSIQQAVANESMSFYTAERAFVGLSHTEAGDAVAEAWNVPETLRRVILHHHEPLDAPDECQNLVSIVHVADTICASLGFGLGADGLAMTLSHEALEKFGLSPSDMLEISAAFLDRYSRAKALLEM